MSVIYGILIGLSLGLTGGGGSIFAVPLLIFGLGLSPAVAISISLMTVVTVSALATAGAIYRKMVDYRIGIIFALGGIISAPVGVKLGNRISDDTIVIAFAVLMIFVAILMWARIVQNPQNSKVVRSDFISDMDTHNGGICRLSNSQKLTLSTPCSIVLAVVGMITGVLTGLFGVGGGFIIVPALTFVTQIDIHRAVATSLMVIVLIGLSGLTSIFIEKPDLPWGITSLFLVGGVAGIILGRTIIKQISGTNLQKIFVFLLIGIAVFILLKFYLFN